MAAVLAVIDADRLPGQPPCSASLLSDVLDRRALVDAGWWKELDPPRLDVIAGGSGQVAGIVAYATRASDQAGLLLLLHGREEQVVISTLVAHALVQLGERSLVQAFAFAAPTSLGLEGLPRAHRPVTHQTLLNAGFEGRDAGGYMHCKLDGFDPPDTRTAEVTPSDDPEGWWLRIRDDDIVTAETLVGLGQERTGVVWWIETNRSYRRRGLGRRLLHEGLAILVEHGATEAFLYVDDDAPPGDDRDRRPAVRLYESFGFTMVDRLWYYELRRDQER